MDVVKEILDTSGEQKVEIFRRADGSYGFAAWTFSHDPFELCWVLDGCYSECYTPDAATAEAEARGRVRWLARAE